MNNINDYKGIFYEDNSERKYYEGGAHFSYEALYQILSNIIILCIMKKGAEFT